MQVFLCLVLDERGTLFLLLLNTLVKRARVDNWRPSKERLFHGVALLSLWLILNLRKDWVLLDLDGLRSLHEGLRVAILTFDQLLLVVFNILLLQLAHLLNFVEVDHEAGLHTMEIFNTFSAENGGVLGAVEMFDALVMLLAEVRHGLLIFCIVNLCLDNLLKVH